MDISLALSGASISLKELENILLVLTPKEINENYNREDVCFDIIDFRVNVKSDSEYVFPKTDYNEKLNKKLNKPTIIIGEDECEKQLWIKVIFDQKENFPLCRKHKACSACCDCNDYENICQCKIADNCENRNKEIIHELTFCSNAFNFNDHICTNSPESDCYYFRNYFCYTCEKENCYQLNSYSLIFTVPINFNEKRNYDQVLNYLIQNKVDHKIKNEKILLRQDRDFAFGLIFNLAGGSRFSKTKSARF